jgi:hypothetical protein
MTFGSTPADSNNIPIGCVYVPGIGFKALQGGKSFTDGSSNDSAPAAFTLTDGYKATYVYSASAIATFVTMQDLVILRGSTTKTVRVTRIEISGAATAATEILCYIKKHTIANTGGTNSNPTPTKYDSSDGGPTALVVLYTTQATVDASATIIRAFRLTLAVTPAATANLNDRYIADFGARPSEAIVLRGVAQELAINFNGQATTAGQVMDITIEWTEE